MKILIEINDVDIRKLAELGEELGLSRSQLIRQAVGEFLQKHVENQNAEELVFGLWKDREAGGLIYQNKIRNEPVG